VKIILFDSQAKDETTSNLDVNAFVVLKEEMNPAKEIN
jgi:hypothetical protein